MFHRQQCDRFIPVRSIREPAFETSFSAGKRTQASTAYSRILSPQTSKYLKFATTSTEKTETFSEFIYKSISKKQLLFNKKQTRKATRILDAPEVVNNFYYNPLDWSKNNRIGIALTQSAYLLSEGKEIVEIDRYSHIPITCLKFHQDHDLCFIGESTGRIEVYDNEKSRKIRQINVHYDRVGTIQKADLPQTFLSGSKDKQIKLNDLRIKKTDVITFTKHKGQICGLSSINHYLASGGNDNRVVIWDLRKNYAINQIREHKSAVKAIAWCPWKTSLLATGGGSQDKRIILWNGNKNVVQSKIQTQSQVIALQWKQSTKQLVSGHFSGKSGYCLVWSGNQIELKLKGHQGRLLGLKLNPNNQDQACTIASDETLRFWDLKQFNSSQSKPHRIPKREQQFFACDFR